MDKTLSMGELRVLDICREIELLNEQLYRHFAVLFSEDQELAALWRKTANEEANHALQFEFASKTKKEMLEAVVMDIQTAANTLKYVHTVFELAKKSPPTVAEALQLSVKLEERLSRLHLECVAVFTEESHKSLFMSMMANDNCHMESLLAAREKHSKRAQ